MTKEEILQTFSDINYAYNNSSKYDTLKHMLDELTDPEPCEDAISREAAQDYIAKYLSQYLYDDVREAVEVIDEYIGELPSVTPKQNTEQFAKWVATEIFDDMWEYNKDAFAEIACRKLAKLGIVREKGNEWELVKPQESENKNGRNEF